MSKRVNKIESPVVSCLQRNSPQKTFPILNLASQWVDRAANDNHRYFVLLASNKMATLRCDMLANRERLHEIWKLLKPIQWESEVYRYASTLAQELEQCRDRIVEAINKARRTVASVKRENHAKSWFERASREHSNFVGFRTRREDNDWLVVELAALPRSLIRALSEELNNSGDSARTWAELGFSRIIFTDRTHQPSWRVSEVSFELNPTQLFESSIDLFEPYGMDGPLQLSDKYLSDETSRHNVLEAICERRRVGNNSCTRCPPYTFRKGSRESFTPIFTLPFGPMSSPDSVEIAVVMDGCNSARDKEYWRECAG